MSIRQENFEFIRDLVKRAAGIVIDQGKEYLVDSRLSTLAHQRGFKSTDDYLVHVRRHPLERAVDPIVEALTINETYFFRDFFPFEALRTTVLPKLIELNRDRRMLNIWSAACATGQEPYSLAMLLREHFPQLNSWRVEVLATDICSTVLGRAQAAEYTQFEVNRGLPAAYLIKYFDKRGENWVLKEELRRTVRFQKINLVHPWTHGEMDLIFVRNVLIYFDADTKRQILGEMSRRLRSGGHLVLGSTETALEMNGHFDMLTVGKSTFYQNKPATLAVAVPLRPKPVHDLSFR